MKLLFTTTKDKVVISATDLIHKLESLREDATKEALRLGYNPSQYTFKPNCNWITIEEDKIKLIFTLEIFENN